MSIEVISGGHVTTTPGFRAGAVAAGIKKAAGALDLAILVSDREATAAGMFTKNVAKAAAIFVSRDRLSGGKLRGVVVNAGCANAFTGQEGIADAVTMTEYAGSNTVLRPEDFAVCSTGVTGVRLPMGKLEAGIARILCTEEGGFDFARAIMTTDTRPKEIAVRVTTDAGAFTVAGCAKGSGMIHPNMATMLAFITTDAAVPSDLLDATLREAVDETINMISIDGDTSCSDTTLLFANGASGVSIEAGTPAASAFRDGLHAVCLYLAKELTRDGEGATKLIEVTVTGAQTVEDARQIARVVSNSPLVKTAVTGCDPNWGRVLVASGRAGVDFDQDCCVLRLQGEPMFERGTVVPIDEAVVSRSMDVPEVRIELDLGAGSASATAWGCDLTTDYVRINADYRT